MKRIGYFREREVLTANRTYYVATTGSDTNDGLSSGTAFATIQKALNVIQATLDVAGYTVTVQLANGTYTENVVCTGFSGGGMVHIKGDETTPANVVIAPTTGNVFAFSGANPGTWTVSGVKMAPVASSVNCVFITSNNQTILVKLVDFGTTTSGQHVTCFYGGYCILESYAISGGAASHVNAQYAGMIVSLGATVTISNTPAFTQFANSTNLGLIRYGVATFSGSATGKRYNASGNGIIVTNGGGATYFPGDVSGTTATGGVYA